MRQVDCPNCGKHLAVPDTSTELKVRCRACNHIFMVSPELQRESSKRGPGIGWPATVGLGIFGIVAAGLLIYVVLNLTGESASEESSTEAEVAVSTPRVVPPPPTVEPEDTPDLPWESDPIVGSAQTEPEREVVEAGVSEGGESEVLAVPTEPAVPKQPDSPKEMTPEELFAKASAAVVRVVVRDKDLKTIGMGSGFFVSSDGLLVTNYHVIDRAESAEVLLSNNAKFTVDGVVASDEEYDLALLKVSGSELPFLNVSDPEPPKVGTTVYAIGNPLGLTSTLSHGLVSALRKDGEKVVLIQTTAAISPGSSGGPLMTADGRVVGVTTAYLEQGQNLNFAVAAAHVNHLIKSAGELISLGAAAGKSLEREGPFREDQGHPGELRRPTMSLHEAAQTGHLAQVKAHLYQEDIDVNVNATDYSGRTPLHLAAMNGFGKVADLLLTNGAEVNAKDDADSTALHWANTAAVAELLLANGAEVNAKDERGYTPLYWAAVSRRTSVAKVLIDGGADVEAQSHAGWTPLLGAAQKGLTSPVRLLLASGADPNKGLQSGYTPLLWAVQEGHTGIARLLLDHGAEVNARTEAGVTSLHSAAGQGKTDIAELLLANGAEVNARTKAGMTALHMAASKARYMMVKLLLDKGADVNARTNSGYTPLALAHSTVADVLREHGGTE